MTRCGLLWTDSPSQHIYIGLGSRVHGSVLEEFPEGHGGTDEDEHSVSSVEGRTIKEDYLGFGGHVVSMCPGLQGWLG